MHILILTGSSDLKQYVQDKGIKINFVCSNLDTYSEVDLDSEFSVLKDIVNSENKMGICFLTQRYDIILTVAKEFGIFEKGNYIEYVELNAYNNPRVINLTNKMKEIEKICDFLSENYILI